MSVVKNKRNISKLEFFNTALDLRIEVTRLLLTDLGIKNKVRKVASITDKMSEKDAEIFTALADKYNYNSVIEEYPQWIITHCRTNILNLLHSLIMNITAANSIYPVTIPEYNQRRCLQDYAIGNCEQLLQEFQFVIDILPVNANRMMHFVGMIEKEIALLKGWRKSDNKILQRIKDQTLKPDNKTQNTIKKK